VVLVAVGAPWVMKETRQVHSVDAAAAAVAALSFSQEEGEEVVVVYADSGDDNVEHMVADGSLAHDDVDDNDIDGGSTSVLQILTSSSFESHCCNSFQPLQHFQKNVKPNGLLGH
jgi:hypothetical protein